MSFNFEDINTTNYVDNVLTIPADITQIGNLSNNTEGVTNQWGVGPWKELTKVVFPDSLQTIANWAFSGALKLTTVVFTGCTILESIPDGGFWGCTALTALDFTGCTALESIGEEAFLNATSLTTIDFTGCLNLIKVDSKAFQNSTSLTTVDFTGCDTLTCSSCSTTDGLRVNAFTNCNNLKIVKFSPWKVAVMHAGAFSGSFPVPVTHVVFGTHPEVTVAQAAATAATAAATAAAAAEAAKLELDHSQSLTTHKAYIDEFRTGRF